ncbi:MAG TPA: AP2 domain-containing protein [Methyloversatilis sp.]
MSRNSVYGISRVDNEASRTHGWLVTIQRRGVIHRKHFSDGVFGGKQKAFAAAKQFRDDIISKFPPFSLREYSSIVKKNNRSGVVGVCRYCASETRDMDEDKQRWFWVASWPLPSGRRKRVKFSVNKYGEEGAFKMALKARKDALKKLDGQFDPGASRRGRPRRAKNDETAVETREARAA